MSIWFILVTRSVDWVMIVLLLFLNLFIGLYVFLCSLFSTMIWEKERPLCPLKLIPVKLLMSSIIWMLHMPYDVLCPWYSTMSFFWCLAVNWKRVFFWKINVEPLKPPKSPFLTPNSFLVESLWSGVRSVPSPFFVGQNIEKTIIKSHVTHHQEVIPRKALLNHHQEVTCSVNPRCISCKK